MENSNVQDYITLSENEESSDELTVLELTSQISNNPNPFKLTTTMTKPQTKVSWVWEYFVRKQSENGEIRAYCQFISDNGENVQKVINMMDGITKFN
ncbi:hypothetical protein RIR_jg34425.t1 [Rhizophagus irregularis DAOM 181602=DAOM 197198]|nr:hypothetical protein RIR_jg34425.t1 [Rhizophagus irregularis DAOM 181602=DAOM 197198]